jgi:group II intron reverse transcriptase/maturase
MFVNENKYPKVYDLQTKLYHAAKASPIRRFHSLRDKLWRKDVLNASWDKVRENRGSGGVDGETIGQVIEYGEDKFLEEIAEAIRTDTYRVKNVKRVYIEKKESGKKRPLGIPVLRDRVVQGAVKILLEPIFEADFENSSFGFRPNRSTKDAWQEISKWLNFGCENIYDADIQSFFDTIDHEKLIDSVKRRIADNYIIRLIRAWLKVGIMEHDKVTYPESGTPQGGVISPLLANIYLNKLDKDWNTNKMASKFECDAKLVRYADDFMVLTSKTLEYPIKKVKEILTSLGLKLNKSKTRVITAKDGFDFLGFRFIRKFVKRFGKWRTYTFPTQEALKHARTEIRKRTNKSLIGFRQPQEIIEDLNRFLRGWSNYYIHTNTPGAFNKIQGYANQRVRIFLRRRRNKSGYGYKEYPSEYLHKVLGLYNICRHIRHLTP